MSEISTSKEVSEFLGKNINKYIYTSFIGEGKCHKYYKSYNMKEKRDCCLKVIDKKKLEKGDYDFLMNQVKREEEIIRLCKCENIINIYDKFENARYIVFELELCKISLADYIKNEILKDDINLYEHILYGVVNALKKLYYNGIIHRNIKPSKIFFEKMPKKKSNNSKPLVKLGGFDCAIYKQDNIFDPVGALFYTAPEIIKNIKYDEKCDLWSFGVTLYEILFGHLPFGNSLNPYLFKKIILYEDNFIYKKTKIEKLDFIFTNLLTINSKNRISHKNFFDYISNCGDIFKNVPEKKLKLIKNGVIAEDFAYIHSQLKGLK